MRKILIISGSLGLGGVQKSLISILNELEDQEISIELALLEEDRDLEKYVPSYVKIINTPRELDLLSLSKKRFLSNSFKTKRTYGLKLFLKYWLYIFKGILWGNMNRARQHLWYEAFTDKKINKTEYDVAIAFQGGLGMYYIADFVKSNKKILWVQSDYRVFKRNLEIDERYIRQMDKIVSVSESCRNIFMNLFPFTREHTLTINPIISPNHLNEMSKENIEEQFNQSEFNILSISRLDPDKGYDLAIPAIKRLIADGYKVKWRIIGDGPFKSDLIKMIDEYDLKGKVLLLGKKYNPYKYLNKSDLFLHPSKFEGKSLAVEEAKALCKPIVITEYSTVYDQINEETGIVVPINSAGIYRGIKKMLDNPAIAKTLSNNLKKETNKTEAEIKKVISLIKDN